MHRRDFIQLTFSGLAVMTAHSPLMAEATSSKVTLKQVDLVVIGDSGVGKSSLVIRSVTGNFVEDYDPTIADSYRKQLDIEDTKYLLEIWDTVAGNAQEKFLDSAFKAAEAVLLCFSIDNPASFEAIKTVWHPMAQKRAPGKPTLLIGCKADLQSTRKVSRVSAEELVKKLGGSAYLECSAKTGAHIDKVISTAARTS